MIPEKTVKWCRLTDTAVQELLLLMSLCDCRGSASTRDILKNITTQRYYRHPVSQLTFTLENIPDTEGYTKKDEDCYIITKRGKVRLRDLCELANAIPSRARVLNREGFNRVKQLRQALAMYPFTNGRCVADGPRENKRTGYCVYAILLHEDSLGVRYQIINPNHDPCLPCVYVGMTKQTPLKRFDEHRFGRKQLRSRYVDPNGLCLMPLLYSSQNKGRMTKEQASAREELFADHLRDIGFAVFAGHLDKPKYRHKDSGAISKG